MKNEKITKKQLLLLRSKTNSKLLKAVINIIIANSVKGRILDYINSVLECEYNTGEVEQLYHYSDTVKFYEKHKNEISDLLINVDNNPLNYFGKKRDENDPLALKEDNKSLLSWFAFKESCLIILDIYGLTY